MGFIDDLQKNVYSEDTVEVPVDKELEDLKGLEIGSQLHEDWRAPRKQDDRTLFTIKTCDVDYENNTYIHTKTTTFEIQTNGLRVYNFKVEQYN